MPVTQHAQKSPSQQPLSENHLFTGKRKLTAVCSHQTRIGNLDAHLI